MCEVEGASCSAGGASLRYHFFLNGPLVMVLPDQRLGGAVSPTATSSV